MAITINLFQAAKYVPLYGVTRKPGGLFVILRTASLAGTNMTGAQHPMRNLAMTLEPAAQNEVATGNGYVQGGKYLENVRLNYESNKVIVRANDVKWKATGGSIVASSAVLAHGDKSDYRKASPIALIDLNGSQTIGDGNAIIIQWYLSQVLSFEA